MATFIAIPILSILMMLQAGILSRFPLLHGTPDLLLVVTASWALHKRVQTAWQWSLIAGLIASLVSALPAGVAFIGYALTTALALVLRRQVWQAPILAVLLTILLGSLASQGINLVAVRIMGSPILLSQAINLVILPSTLLNLLLAVPTYLMLGDLANWLYPEELEV